MGLVVDNSGKIFDDRREPEKDRRQKSEKVEIDNRKERRRTKVQKSNK